MTSYVAPMCMYCKHYNKKDMENCSCAAYPKVIPDAILHSEVDHRKPYKGDHGIQFEAGKEALPDWISEFFDEPEADEGAEAE